MLIYIIHYTDKSQVHCSKKWLPVTCIFPSEKLPDWWSPCPFIQSIESMERKRAYSISTICMISSWLIYRHILSMRNHTNHPNQPIVSRLQSSQSPQNPSYIDVTLKARLYDTSNRLVHTIHKLPQCGLPWLTTSRNKNRTKSICSSISNFYIIF